MAFCIAEAIFNRLRTIPASRSKRCVFPPVVADDFLRVEAVKGGAIVFALLQNRVPAEAGLRTLQYQELEQHAVVVLRDAPFVVVIED